MSQELKRTFHKVTLEEQEQVSSQKPRRGSLWPTEQGAARHKGLMSNNLLSLQWPRLGITILATLLRRAFPPPLPSWSIQAWLDLSQSCPQYLQLGISSLSLCAYTCSQTTPIFKTLPSFVLSSSVLSHFLEQQVFALIFLKLNLLGKVPSFSLSLSTPLQLFL